MVHAPFASVQGTLPGWPPVDLAAQRTMDFAQRCRIPERFTNFATHFTNRL
jgi:hypothetical protein